MSSQPPKPLATDALPWWPAEALPLALSRLGKADLSDRDPDPDWVVWACERLGIQLDRAPVRQADLTRSLKTLAPGLVWHPKGTGFLVVYRRGWLTCPDGSRIRADLDAISRALTPVHPSLQRQGRRVAALVNGGEALAHALCMASRAGERVEGLWRLRPAPHRLWKAAISARLPQLAMGVLTLALLTQGFEIWLWALLGGAALEGRAPMALALIGLFMAPVLLGLGQGLLAETLTRRLATILRQRLLHGALRIQEGALKHDGPEGFLARGLEAQGFESAATALLLGLPLALAGTIWAIWVLAEAGHWLAPLFIALLALQPLLIRHFAEAAQLWTEARRGLTAQLIGWMIGHRSLAQLGKPETILANLSQPLKDYAERSARMDRRSLLAFALLPNGWTLLALILLLLLGLGETTETRAVTLGGVLLAARAFVAMAGMWASLGALRIAYQQIAPLWQASPTPPEPTFPPVPRTDFPRLQLKAALARPDRNLDLKISLSVPAKARIWLTGASGAGKSSLLRLLTGADALENGELYSGSRPMPKRHVNRVAALVPQFQDNHVFNGSLAYNLLLSRAWPASPDDLVEAQEVAEALGLGPLIVRMPGGLSTHLGQTGWQLSQGERSRLFLARAILQRTSVLALDESLAALDPSTEAACLGALEERADAIVLVRHA